jgi:choline dehydrogenase-like flavoprotein
MSEEDIHTVIGTLHEFKNIVNKNKIGRFVPEKQLIDSEKQMKYLEVEAHAEGHQMGTTRMGSSETSSVCDNTGKVWRTTNLFVFGASLFPRGGAANPGLTSVALALRNIKKIMHTHLI